MDFAVVVCMCVCVGGERGGGVRMRSCMYGIGQGVCACRGDFFVVVKKSKNKLVYTVKRGASGGGWVVKNLRPNRAWYVY
jgi:hypothetical protein